MKVEQKYHYSLSPIFLGSGGNIKPLLGKAGEMRCPDDKTRPSCIETGLECLELRMPHCGVGESNFVELRGEKTYDCLSVFFSP